MIADIHEADIYPETWRRKLLRVDGCDGFGELVAPRLGERNAVFDFE